MRRLDAVIADVPLFDGLGTPELELLAGCARNVHFDTGDWIFREGEPADEFYVVRHGRVALEAHVPPRGALSSESIEDGGVRGWSGPFTRSLRGRMSRRIRSASSSCRW